MFDMYPFNRLHKYYEERRSISWKITLSLAAALAIVLLIPHSYASGFSDPTNAPGFPFAPPSVAYGSFCPSGSTSCPKYFWFAGDQSFDGHSTTVFSNETCVWVGLTGEFAALDTLTGPGNGSYYAKWSRGPDGGSDGIACWNGATWTSVQRNSIYVNQDSISVDGTGVHWTPITLGLYANYITTNGTVYACGGAGCDSYPSIVDDDFITGPNVDTSQLTITGPDAAPTDSSTPFLIKWSGQFPVYYVYFEENSSGSTLAPFSYNYPLGGTGSYTLYHTYNREGTYTPTVFVGNAHCGGFAGDHPTGSGCTYKQASYNPLEIISPTQTPPGWLNGGYTSNYGPGSGYLMQSSRIFYQLGEVTPLKWAFNSDSTIQSVSLFYDQGISSPLWTRTGSGDIAENVEHTGTVTYQATGVYQPYIQIRYSGYSSGNPATYRNIFLGGGTTANPAYAINVEPRQVIYGPAEGSGKNALGVIFSSGGMLETGTTNTGTGAGIFGLDVFQNFNGFGHTGNSVLDALQDILISVFKGLIWVAERLYQLLTFSKFFSFLFGMMHPAAGTYHLPCTMFNKWSTGSLCNMAFTITYNADPQVQGFTDMAQVFFFSLLFIWIGSHFLFHE